MSLPATTKNIPSKYAGTWDDQGRDNRRPRMTLARKILKWAQNKRKSTEEANLSDEGQKQECVGRRWGEEAHLPLVQINRGLRRCLGHPELLVVTCLLQSPLVDSHQVNFVL